MSEYDHDPELYVAMIAGRDKRIRELEKYKSAFFRVGAEIAKSGCCEHGEDAGHLDNCTREHLMVRFLRERKALENTDGR